ncbi:glutamine synthetase [Bradyrhizobium diazoefficiens]|uniref:Glutamine synthetase n=1 Tax=Bradyrhizobium diazoefficiens TaxID=1355477 RepID=A0A0E4FTB5_9BRAD|nr:glutamine synthetase [Bradyrhizobium diazoefficiens]
MTFVARHALWSDEQKDAAQRMRRIVEEKNLEVIRLAFPDQHGILRGKTIIAAEAIASLESGCSITTTMLAKDTSHRTVFPVFIGRRVRHEGDGGRSRRADGCRSHHLPRAAMGADHGLGAVRSPFQ